MDSSFTAHVEIFIPEGKKNNLMTFDEEMFDKIMDKNIAYYSTEPISYSMFNGYYCALINLHEHQRDVLKINSYLKEELRSSRVKALQEEVRSRRQEVNKNNYREKFDREFLPYQISQKVPDIAEVLWNRNSSCKKYYMSSLRDRFCFLMTHSGIIRGESLFKAEMSDMCMIKKDDEGPATHICSILIL